MEHKLSTKFCKYLIQNSIISNKYYDVYVYGMELLFSFLFSISIIMFIGILTDSLLPTITYLIIFITLRNFTGGYHANTYFKCKMVSIIVYSLSMISTRYINVSTAGYIILGIIGYLTIYILAPVENPNKPLTASEHKKHKMISLILFSLIYWTGIIINIYSVGSDIIFFTLLSVIILMIISSPRMKGGSIHEEDLQDHC